LAELSPYVLLPLFAAVDDRAATIVLEPPPEERAVPLESIQICRELQLDGLQAIGISGGEELQSAQVREVKKNAFAFGQPLGRIEKIDDLSAG
jgi:hypothetical protein